MYIVKIVLLLSTCVIYGEPANILAFPTFPGYSHFIIIEPLLKGLAERGHNVTVVSYFPQKKPIKNYIDIDISHTMPLVTNNISIDFLLNNMRRPTDFMQFVYKNGFTMCKSILEEKVIQEMINATNVKYDLVITELFGADCFTAFAYKQKVPLISIVTTIGLPWAYQRIANPDNPSYITNYFLPEIEKMTLLERLHNTVITTIANVGYYFLSDLPTYLLTKQYFGESLPPLHQVYQNTSLMMVNSHHSYRQIQPLLPNLIEIGGIHLIDSKPLPKDLKEILDSSTKGVIVLTLGSMIKFSTMPSDMQKAFLSAFTKFAHTILWQVEVEDQGTNLPPNVITTKWIPVKEVLEHPNVKLLIMHGGMATTIEAINAGVPVVGIPMYADQPGNIQSLVNKGVAISIDYFDVTANSLYNAIIRVLTDSRYSENARKLSKLFKDREHTPLETALFWTEYVLRHKGAYHLQSPAIHIPWYQLVLLDVIFIIITAVCLIIFILYTSIKIGNKLLFRQKTKQKQG